MAVSLMYLISMENDSDLISNKQELVELFNEHYINKVEKSSGKKPLLLQGLIQGGGWGG